MNTLRLSQPAFLGAAFDFLLGNEADVVVFGEHAGMARETMLVACLLRSARSFLLFHFNGPLLRHGLHQQAKCV